MTETTPRTGFLTKELGVTAELFFSGPVQTVQYFATTGAPQLKW